MNSLQAQLITALPEPSHAVRFGVEEVASLIALILQPIMICRLPRAARRRQELSLGCRRRPLSSSDPEEVTAAARSRIDLSSLTAGTATIHHGSQRQRREERRRAEVPPCVEWRSPVLSCAGDTLVASEFLLPLLSESGRAFRARGRVDAPRLRATGFYTACSPARFLERKRPPLPRARRIAWRWRDS